MKNLILIIAIACSINVFSQIHDPVKWSTSVEKISQKRTTDFSYWKAINRKMIAD